MPLELCECWPARKTPEIQPAHTKDDSGEIQATSQSSLRHSGLRITFQRVCYRVKNDQNRKEMISLLSDVSGYLLPGQMSTIMGPSGSGKTTLLDILAGRKTTGTITGEVLYSGVKPSQTFLRHYTGYVEQFDTLLGTLTARDMLLYTADLKRSHHESTASKIAHVDELLAKLDLQTCQHVRIGSTLARGISGGQAKRVNIGIALITEPRILYMDEPTSGLDSFTGNQVIKVVRALVTSNITMCCSIHSPTPFAFRSFDRLIILIRGQVVFFGQRGQEAVEYFQHSAPAAESLGEGAHEAEWIVDITHGADGKNKGAELVTAYKASFLAKSNAEEIKRFTQHESTLHVEAVSELQTTSATVTPFWWAIKTLFKYRTANNFQQIGYLGPRTVDKLVCSLLIMTVYWKVGEDLSQGNIINIAAVLFMWQALPAFGAAVYIPTIVLERPLFVRERNDGLYRVITYLCFKIVEEVIVATAASLIFSCMVFFPLALPGSWLVFWLDYVLTISVGIVLAYLVAALSPNMIVANAALPTYVVSLMFFAGFLLRWENIPAYWIWYAVIDFMRYGFGSVVIDTFDGTDANIGGQPVLEYYSLAGKSKWLFLLYEVIFFVCFFILAFLTLQFKRFQRR